jgi:phage terminase small subunit
MSQKKRRTRTDSVEFQTQVLQDAAKPPIEPPAHSNLPKKALPYWYAVVDAKARRAWTDHDLEIAVDLAWCKYRADKIMTQLEDEPDVIINQQGNEVLNPLHKALDTVSKRARMLAAHLQVHPEATQGKSHVQKDQNEGHQKAKQAITGEPNAMNGLIPGINAH